MERFIRKLFGLTFSALLAVVMLFSSVTVFAEEYDSKKSIVIGAQKRSIELERFKLLLCIAALFFQDDKSLEPIFLQRVIWQHCNVYLPLVF